MKVGKFFGLFKQAGQDFMADSAPRLGASVAYYTIFSLSPLLLIVLAVLTFYFHGESNARHELFGQISSMVGPKGAETIQSLLNQPQNEKHSFFATIIATVTLILGSTGVFMELQAALNTIWDVKQQPGAGIWGFVKHRLLSFAMVLTIGFLLLVSLVVTAAITVIGKKVSAWMPGMEAISQILNFVASFGIITVLFAFIFKYMPDVRMPWKVVWIGAAFTSLLFAIGKFALGMYIGKNSASNAFGAAGSLVVILLWVYYSAQILFFGAEITQAYAKLKGIEVAPKQHAATNHEESAKDQSPTKGAPVPQPNRAPQPAGGSFPAPGRKPGFVMPAVVLLLALVLPKRRARHS
jgi:membrane protein